jgi:transcriptional regulator with GAF, ATPase, and Fis domain/CheY-like chemotaxis protein
LISSLDLRKDSGAVRILLVSGNAAFREQMSSRLGPLHWTLSEARSGSEALEMLHVEPGTEVLLLDPLLPDLLPTEFCGMVRQRFPGTEILTMNATTGHVLVGSSTPTPFAKHLAEMLYQGKRSIALRPANETSTYLRNTSSSPGLRGMIGDSPVMKHVYALTHMVAARETTVLITGESGTGKDLIAQSIHMISHRQKSPFIVVNCAAIPEALLEAELFGYAKGAFTGAMQSRIGRIHAAHGGTLFLDEIGDMPLALQSKILRFVEQGEVQRLGSNENLRVDVRVVAATNATLPSLVKQKLFREDLYYRLAVFPIKLPPLRERQGDVTGLAHYFASKFSPGVFLTPEAIDALHQHDWPGNVRELRNVMERASILAGTERELTPRDIVL